MTTQERATFHSLLCHRTTQKWATVALPSRLIGVIAELVMDPLRYFAILRRKPNLFLIETKKTRIKILIMQNSKLAYDVAIVLKFMFAWHCHFAAATTVSASRRMI
jgi:hypothetical protein